MLKCISNCLPQTQPLTQIREVIFRHTWAFHAMINYLIAGIPLDLAGKRDEGLLPEQKTTWVDKLKRWAQHPSRVYLNSSVLSFPNTPISQQFSSASAFFLLHCSPNVCPSLCSQSFCSPAFLFALLRLSSTAPPMPPIAASVFKYKKQKKGTGGESRSSFFLYPSCLVWYSREKDSSLLQGQQKQSFSETFGAVPS